MTPQQKARKAYQMRQVAAGGSRVTFLLSKQATDVLERLAKIHGSRTKVIEALLAAHENTQA